MKEQIELGYLKSIDENLKFLVNIIKIREEKNKEEISNEEEEEYTGDYDVCEKCGDEFEAYAFGNSHMCDECVNKEIADAEVTKETIRKEL